MWRRCGSSNLSRLANYPGGLPSVRTKGPAGPARFSWAASNPPLLMARIVAAPLCGDPFRMSADPVGDIGLRCHHALMDRAFPGELKIFFFAIGRIGEGA